MRKLLLISLACTGLCLSAQSLDSEDIMDATENVADYFIAKYPDVGAKSNVGGKVRNSKIWTRGVFYEGMLNAYRENSREDWLKYCTDWGDFHSWISSSDNEASTYNADYQCCGQAYIQMYMMDQTKPERMEHIKMRIDELIESGRINVWYWVDAIQMAMPVMAMLGEITGEDIYHERMNELYVYSRNSQGGNKRGGGSPLFNEATGLWYRDYKFDPPYKDKVETDKDCYWSRGNGWAYMALARVLQFTSETASHRDEYEADFLSMSRGLKNCQHDEGWWNVSLAAPTNFGSAGSEGPEMTGSSLFVGGMAWGVRTGRLAADEYLPAIIKGWDAMKAAVHDSGKVGYLQGTGSSPEDGGPITYDSEPDFEDFGVGCWLWGAAEVHALARQLELEQSIITTVNADYRKSEIYYDMMGRRVDNPVDGHLYLTDGKKLIYRSEH